MSHVYVSYFKLIENKRHYFVKKFLHLTDCGSVSDILEGYGMHTEFKKACMIAGIKESYIQQQIFDSMEINNSEAKIISMNNTNAVIRTIAG